MTEVIKEGGGRKTGHEENIQYSGEELPEGRASGRLGCEGNRESGMGGGRYPRYYYH